jgi:hypothetical protein
MESIKSWPTRKNTTLHSTDHYSTILQLIKAGFKPIYRRILVPDWTTLPGHQEVEPVIH